MAVAQDAHQFGGGVRKARSAARNEIDVTGKVQLADLNFFHPAMLDFPTHAHPGNDRDADAHLHKPFDAFDGGHFDGHVESGAISCEEFDHAAPVGRLDDVSNERLFVEIRDIDFAALGKRMLEGNDQSEFVLEDFGGLKLGIPGDEGDGADVEAIVEDFVGNIAGEHPMDADLNAGVEFAEFR